MSFINQQSVSFLRWSALAVGVWWGWTRHHSLTRFVKDRAEEQHEAHHKLLVEEAKIAYEAQYNREQAALASKAGVPAIDSNSLYFDAEKWSNWATAQNDAEEAAAKAKAAAKK
ncbi:F1F0 ATP synthase subunit e, mitochondrial [Polyrhizophydium stewartii]|uniref:ATP synthase F(0) complex subunit e, mitochondrial n=1 Tax=Polyrhizophydium stewartii TaxID=2732419 RepID=A0ABR4N793_9FUNG|nr:hypothetical protein HK105_004398 [Polyrhizophydium stewartii]